jgi:hypothetical protein
MDGLPQMSADDVAQRIALQDFAAVCPAVNPLRSEGEITALRPECPVALQYRAEVRRISATLEHDRMITGLQHSHKFA